MRFASITDRLQDLGGAKWALHNEARRLKNLGHAVIDLTIGNPDCAPDPALIDRLIASVTAGRVAYSNGRGEAGLIAALQNKYSKVANRPIRADQILAFPGTQTALFAVMTCLLETGDEVIVADPAYATYDGVIAATGATFVPAPLHAAHDFRLQPKDVEERVTPRTRAILINTPHNPTGSILTRDDITGLGAIARKHGLWLVSDEVYDALIFPGEHFHSLLGFPDLADQTIVVSSISKTHAVPGFRSGWCIGPSDFCHRALPVSEAMLFGNQPFIADSTAFALENPSNIASGMAARFSRRADLICDRLNGKHGLSVRKPQAGMFTLIDLRAIGCSGNDFAMSLLKTDHVALMPGESFGSGMAGWLRMSLTQSDDIIEMACDKILKHVAMRRGV